MHDPSHMTSLAALLVSALCYGVMAFRAEPRPRRVRIRTDDRRR